MPSGRHNGHKPPMIASSDFEAIFERFSKAALIDTLWCACQLGTNDSEGEILTQAARNAVCALRARGDKVGDSLERQLQGRYYAENAGYYGERAVVHIHFALSADNAARGWKSIGGQDRSESAAIMSDEHIESVFRLARLAAHYAIQSMGVDSERASKG